MEQRRVRLGDIVDDYCPRERRLTNHAVVAMIEDEIRQTRCTACDAEHAYKAARVPRGRRKDTLSATGGTLVVPRAADAAEPAEESASVADQVLPEAEAAVVPSAPAPVADSQADLSSPVSAEQGGEPGPTGEPEPAAVHDGPVHRPLIRAQLPRPDGQTTARPVPEFTMRQSGVRGSRLIEGDARGPRPASNGSRPPQHVRHGHRPGGQGQSHGRPHGAPQGGSRYDRSHGHGGRGQRPAHAMHGGKKRSR